MTLDLAQVVFDYDDAATLAGFWAGVLRRPPRRRGRSPARPRHGGRPGSLSLSEAERQWLAARVKVPDDEQD
jgi:hypothetical protein